MTRSVGLSVDSSSSADGTGAANPVWWADGFLWIVCASAVQPCRASGFHFNVADLLRFCNGGCDVDVAVADVAPCEASELLRTNTGEEEQGEGCAGIHGACGHESGCLIWRVDDDGFALHFHALHSRVGRFLYEFSAHGP